MYLHNSLEDKRSACNRHFKLLGCSACFWKSAVPKTLLFLLISTMKCSYRPEQQLRTTTSFIAGSPGSRKVVPLGQSDHSPSCLLTGRRLEGTPPEFSWISSPLCQQSKHGGAKDQNLKSIKLFIRCVLIPCLGQNMDRWKDWHIRVLLQ